MGALKVPFARRSIEHAPELLRLDGLRTHTPSKLLAADAGAATNRAMRMPHPGSQVSLVGTNSPLHASASAREPPQRRKKSAIPLDASAKCALIDSRSLESASRISDAGLHALCHSPLHEITQLPRDRGTHRQPPDDTQLTRSFALVSRRTASVSRRTRLRARREPSRPALGSGSRRTFRRNRTPGRARPSSRSRGLDARTRRAVRRRSRHHRSCSGRLAGRARRSCTRTCEDA